MTTSHAILSMFTACCLLAVHAQALAQPQPAPAPQVLATPASPAVQAAPQAPARPGSAATLASAGLKTVVALRGLAAGTSFTAAGSVVLLADGIVADARIAQVQPPAPGFQYER